MKTIKTWYLSHVQETVAWKHIILQFICFPSKIVFWVYVNNHKKIKPRFLTFHWLYDFECLLGFLELFLLDGSLDGIQIQENSEKMLVFEMLQGQENRELWNHLSCIKCMSSQKCNCGCTLWEVCLKKNWHIKPQWN